jgi:hypothetical protein
MTSDGIWAPVITGQRLYRPRLTPGGDGAHRAARGRGQLPDGPDRPGGQQSEKDAKLAQKLGSLQPFFSCISTGMHGQLASFEPT